MAGIYADSPGFYADSGVTADGGSFQGGIFIRGFFRTQKARGLFKIARIIGVFAGGW